MCILNLLREVLFSSLTVTGINKAQYSLGISWVIIQVSSMDSIKGQISPMINNWSRHQAAQKNYLSTPSQDPDPYPQTNGGHKLGALEVLPHLFITYIAALQRRE